MLLFKLIVSLRGYLSVTREAKLLEEIGFSDFSVIFENYFLIDVFHFMPSEYLHTFKIIFIKIC